MKKTLMQFGPVALTIGLLVYVRVFADIAIVTQGRDEFRQRARQSIQAFPTDIGPGWRGERASLDQRTIDLLDPNAYALVNYRYADRIDVAFSVIQCKDARFMTGHAPTNCYPNLNYTIDKQKPRTWKLGKNGEIEIRGATYSMRRQSENGVEYRTVYSFFIFPDGRMGWTLDHLDRVAEDYRKLAYGVAQVLVETYGPPLTDEQRDTELRDSLFKAIVGHPRSLEMIRVLQAGIPR